MTATGTRFVVASSLVLAGVLAIFSGCRAGNLQANADGGPERDAGTSSDAMDPDSRAEVPVVVPAPDIVVATVAGSDQRGSAEGTGAAAQFENPVGVAVDAIGVLFVTEYEGARLRRIDKSGATSTVATGLPEPFALLLARDTFYVQTDRDRNGQKGDDTGTIWKVDPTNGVTEVFVEGLSRPRGLALLFDGRMLVSDRERHTLSIINVADRTLTPLAGSGVPGFADGIGANAQFQYPYGAAILPDGNIVVADSGNHCIRKITLAGEVTRFAGEGLPGMRDAPDKLLARFDTPVDVATDVEGNVFVSDTGNHRIRRISPSGVVETIAGDGVRGFADGVGAAARFYGQEQIDVTPDGKTVYVSDGSVGEDRPFHRVRRITIP